MKHIILGFFFVFSLSITHGQIKSGNFDFIEINTDTSSLKFIDTYRQTSKTGDDLVSIYNNIKNQANNKGANCYRVVHLSRDTNNHVTFIINTYLGDKEFLEGNKKNHEINTVFVLGDANPNNKPFSFNGNNIKRTIPSGSYYKYKIPINGQVKINKGGFSGSTVKIKWGPNNQCKFISVSGFGLADNQMGFNSSYTGKPGVGVSFTTGKIMYLDQDFGLFMTLLLKQS